MTMTYDGAVTTSGRVGPDTFMTTVAVDGGDAAALVRLLTRLCDRVTDLGDVELHDVVVTLATSLPGQSVATVYFGS